MKCHVWAAILAFVTSVASTTPIAEPIDAGSAPESRSQSLSRTQLADRIISRWSSYVEDVFLGDARSWAREMAPILARASLESLRQAADANRFKAMNDALLMGDTGRAAARNAVSELIAGNTQPKAFGDSSTDLVFVPVAPCRIVDTRVAGGRIPANSARGFDVTVASSYTSQGGSPTNCGIGASGVFAGAAFNLTVVDPSGPGFLTAYPGGTSRPTASNVNYTTGAIVANFAIVKLAQGFAASDLLVYSQAETHLVIDVLGYFTNPQATALDCVERSTSGPDIPAGTYASFFSPSCGTGYTLTGGGCFTQNANARLVSSYTTVGAPGNGAHFCAFFNEGLGVAVTTGTALCCRIPGRNP